MTVSGLARLRDATPEFAQVFFQEDIRTFTASPLFSVCHLVGYIGVNSYDTAKGAELKSVLPTIATLTCLTGIDLDVLKIKGMECDDI